MGQDKRDAVWNRNCGLAICSMKILEKMTNRKTEKPAETTAPDEEKHSINWGALILWPVVILILYVLIIGPVMMMMDKSAGSRSNQLARKFYAPLGWAYDNTPLHKPLGMYLHLWVPEIFNKNGNLGYEAVH